jgi:hypothetical protein
MDGLQTMENTIEDEGFVLVNEAQAIHKENVL